MPRPTSVWTEELIAKLTLLWTSHSGTEISDILRRDHHVWFSKNACIGKAARLGLPRKTPLMTDAKPRHESAPKPVRTAPMKLVPRPLPFKPRIVNADPLLIPFEELNDSICKYECTSNDHPADFRFCGLPKCRGSYCFQHAKISYVEPNAHRRPFVPSRAA